MTSTPTVKDQYHHFIPRFILRRFQVPGPTPVALSPSKRKRKHIPQEYIYYYNLATRELELRAIATVYGSTNLYKDIRSADVMEVEKKLSVLESSAGRTVSTIEKTIGVGATVTLRRGDVEDLRRFLFVMHYRSQILSETYFRDELNSGAPWMKVYREKHGLKSASDMWLHVLRYYLDEPHEQMIAEYLDAVRKYGLQYNEMVCAGTDETIKYEALAYGMQADRFFTSIWEAADGEEFLLGHNTFGLWEGLLMGLPAVHRIFIVSPRIAIVLRDNIIPHMDMSHMDMSTLSHTSSLLDIQVTPPSIRYHPSCPSAPDVESLAQYRRTAEAKTDTFIFTKAKLTVSQTDALNSVVLCNVRGSMTFRSIQSTLRTLRTFMNTRVFQNYLTRHLFHPLVETLTYPTLLPTVPKAPPSSSRSASSANLAQPSAPKATQPSESAPSKSAHRDSLSASRETSLFMPTQGFTLNPQPSSDDHPLRMRLRELIYAELAGVSPFQSRYGAVYAIHRLCQHDEMPGSEFLSEQRQLVAQMSRHVVRAFKNPPPSGFEPRPENLLVKDLSEQKSQEFFSSFAFVCERLLGVTEGNDWLSRLSRQVAMVGVAERLAQTRSDILETFAARISAPLLR